MNDIREIKNGRKDSERGRLGHKRSFLDNKKSSHNVMSSHSRGSNEERRSPEKKKSKYSKRKSGDKLRSPETRHRGELKKSKARVVKQLTKVTKYCYDRATKKIRVVVQRRSVLLKECKEGKSKRSTPKTTGRHH